MIEFKELSKSYLEGQQKHLVLDALEGSFQQGEFVAIVGKSGCGKSTFLNLISGIDEADQGEVRIGDTTITKLSEKDRTLFRRRHIGFVFQDFNLVETLSARENILLPLQLNGLDDNEALETLQELLKRLDIEARVDDYPDHLSGGEQQRVAIARALVHQPSLVLADEPTGNLDLETGKEVLELLVQLVRDSGVTLVMVTHSTEVMELADRVLSIQDGKLVARPNEELSAQG